LARAVGGEIVNADSQQLYADLAVLTARPTPEDTAQTPHHLFGVADAADAWSVGRWLRAAAAVVDDIRGRGAIPILVGGTGLYFRAWTRGLADIPPVPPEAREQARALWEGEGEGAVRARLASVDPAAEARIAPGDRQRLTRALEVALATGRPLSAWQSDPPSGPGEPGIGIALLPGREALYARIDARFDAMLDAGAEDEVRRLLTRGLDPALPAMKATGVRELVASLRGEIGREEAIEQAKRETRRYAKRQTTWIRHQLPDWPRVTSLDPQGQWAELAALPLFAALLSSQR
jgi:tRNA dimethylallyltransferase